MDRAEADAVFHAYDVRGIADRELSDEFAHAIGNAFVRWRKISLCAVGRDVREASPRLHRALIEGIRSAGCSVIDLGVVSTAYIKWITAEKRLPASVMVTASHNPPEYDGFKFYGPGGVSIGQADGLHELKRFLGEPSPAPSATLGKLTQHDWSAAYVAFLTAVLSASERPVFIDPSGGSDCAIAKRLAASGFNLTLYNAEPDPHFTLHHPNPLEPEATAAAREYCHEHGCIGAVLDADADRIVFIDEEGGSVPPEFIGAWLCSKIVRPGESVVATVSCSRAVRDAAQASGAAFHLTPVGNAVVHNTLLREHGHLGVEKSGHLFFAEAHGAEAPWLCLLLVLKHLRGRLVDAMRPYRERYQASPEINLAVTDKQAALKAAQTHYAPKGTMNLLDGVLCEGNDWWVSLRASNTEPLLRLSFEARDHVTYESLEGEARAILRPFIKETAPTV